MQAFNKIALSAACIALPLISGCGEKRVVTNLAPPSERLQCVFTGTRPTIPPEYQIDWSKVATVRQARAEHDAYVRTIRNREGIISAYIVDIEGKLFACSNNAAWLRDFYKATAK